MAILKQPETNNALDLFGLDRENLPPAGTFAAKVLDIQDKFGVERTKFQSTETETVDLTAFLFGYVGPDGRKYRIDTRPMKISGHPKSALYKFLTALMGRAPAYGWDYAELKGTTCLLTVTGRGKLVNVSTANALTGSALHPVIGNTGAATTSTTAATTIFCPA